MGGPFAESRPALDNEEHLGPETRKTAQWAASMSRRTGDDQLFGNTDLHRKPALSSSRKRRFSTTAELCRMCAAPLWRAFQPEGELVPASQSPATSTAPPPPLRRPTFQPSLPLPCPACGRADHGCGGSPAPSSRLRAEAPT